MKTLEEYKSRIVERKYYNTFNEVISTKYVVQSYQYDLKMWGDDSEFLFIEKAREYQKNKIVKYKDTEI